MPDFSQLSQDDMMRIGGGVLVLILLIWGISKLMPKKQTESEHIVDRKCPGCGWKGRASKFVLKCPQCKASLALP